MLKQRFPNCGGGAVYPQGERELVYEGHILILNEIWAQDRKATCLVEI
jgi:hypothetical protein